MSQAEKLNPDDLCEKVSELVDQFDLKVIENLTCDSKMNQVAVAQKCARSFLYMLHLDLGLEFEKDYPQEDEAIYSYFGSFPSEVYNAYREISEAESVSIQSLMVGGLLKAQDCFKETWLDPADRTPARRAALSDLKNTFSKMIGGITASMGLVTPPAQSNTASPPKFSSPSVG